MTRAGTLISFVGRVGDHNDRAMPAAAVLGRIVADRWDLEELPVGRPATAPGADWRTELAAAREPLLELASALHAAGHAPCLTVLPRCAGALATLPVVLRQRPDACVVWFDAHADLHLPATTTSGYLGGMALSGGLGWWDTGHGAGPASRVVLAGTRDVDEGEQQLIERQGVVVVPPGPGFAERLAAAVGERPVHVHLDCDVLEPGIVPTDYRVPGGLALADLRAALQGLAEREVVGVEIAELEEHPDRTMPDVEPLLAALAPLQEVVGGT